MLGWGLEKAEGCSHLLHRLHPSGSCRPRDALEQEETEHIQFFLLIWVLILFLLLLRKKKAFIVSQGSSDYLILIK